MKIKSIHIEGMHNISKTEYTFDQSNYIVGPNGSGKSTILQAIQFCFLGYIPGTNKTKTAIFEHCNGSNMEVKIYLESDDGGCAEVSRSLKKSGSSLEESFELNPPSVSIDSLVGGALFPVLNFNEFMGMTANKKKELLISIVPTTSRDMNSEEILKSIPEYNIDCAGIVESVCSEYPNLESIESIKSINEALKSIQSRLASDEKRLAATSQSLIYYDDYTGEEDVESLKSKIEEVTQRRDSAVQAQVSRKLRLSCEEKLKAFETLSDSIEDDQEYLAYKSEESKLADLIAETESEFKNIEKSVADLTFTIEQNSKIVELKGVCPYTDKECSDIKDNLEALQLEITSQIEAKDDLLSDLQRCHRQLNIYRIKVSEIQSSISDLEEKYRDRDKLESERLTYQEVEEVDVEELTSELNALTDNLAKASANQKYQELMGEVQSKKLELDSQIKFIKSAVKLTGENGLQTKLAQEPFELLENSMNEDLDTLGIKTLGKIEFKLAEKANSFNFGVNRGNFIPFELMSSGEQCLFAFIFLINLIDVSNSDLKLVMMDDLFDHLDDDKFKTVINSNLQNCNKAQIIVAGVKVPETSNINVIRVGD